MLDATKLATLRAVVRHGSFSAAGEELALTQPAVSRQVSVLEAQLGTQLVRRTRQGVHPTEAGRVLVEHADAVVRHLAAAEAEVAELAGLRRGSVRLGSFFTALVYLSAEAAVVLEERHPELFAGGDVIRDELVDRRTALRRLAAGELDVAIVFEVDAEPDPAPPGVEIVALFDDPVRVLLPAAHPLAAGDDAVAPRDLRGDTWIRAPEGTAARLVDRVLRQARIAPRTVPAGRGDEPVEAQALVAAGKGVTLGYDLNVVLDRERVAVRPLAARRVPVRHVQAAIMRDDRSPVARAVVDALREVGRRRR
jgi:DNA-binding transcriptional LysR family regulator